MIKRLKRVDPHNMVIKNFPWMVILNTHLIRDRDILACQEELISAGFKEFAKL